VIDTPEETAETVTQSHWDILGERDFNGDTFTILDAPHHTHLQVNFSVAEELTGEPINDALYLRDRFIEDKYNVNINFIQIPGFGEGNRVLERAVIAGDNTYDLIVSPVFGNSLDTMSTRNVLYNLIDAPYLSLQSPWWSKMLYDNMQFNGKLHYTGGDIFLPSYSQCPAAIMYNQRLFRDHAIEDNLYDLVFEGKWTIDVLDSLTRDANIDLNGDGIMHADDDFFGLISQNLTINMSFYLAGLGVNFSATAGDEITVDMTSPSTLSRIDRLAGMIERINYHDQEDTIQKTFKGGRALFLTHCLISPQLNLRDMEDGYGILPMPKWEEAQENYVSFINAWGSGFVGISKIADIEKAAFLTEAMAYAGYEMLRRPVYEITFYAKGARDAESERIIDIIIETAYLDLGSVYNFGGVQELFVDTSIDNRPFVSAFERRESVIQRDIDRFVAAMSFDD